MLSYNPDRAPDPEAWKATLETSRIDAVRLYHERRRIRMPNHHVHALMHVIVENQLAEGDALPTKAKLAELMADGLNRHQAIHAISTVVGTSMFRILGDTLPKDVDPGADFRRELEKLTAAKWLRMTPED
jgi:hypothetical protein